MNKINNEPAFPVDELNQVHGGVCAQHFGVTMRDYFAIKALAAMLANPDKEGAKRGKAGLLFFPGYAYEWADAMLKAREE
jgi:hypothetical protein